MHRKMVLTAARTSPEERTVMVRLLAFVFFAGPSFAMAWVALPHTDPANDGAIVAVCLSAWVCGAILLRLPAQRVPDVVLQATLLAGAVLISMAQYFTGAPDSGFGMFFLWTAPYAYFFFSARHAALHTAWIGICFAAALFLQQERRGGLQEQAGALAADWLIVVGTVVIVGVLVRRLADWMRESDTRFRRGFDDSSIGLALIGTDLRYLEVNLALCGMVGRCREDLVGLHVNDLTVPDDVGVSPGAADEAFGGEEQQTFEKRLLHADGSHVVVSVNSSLVHSANGRPLYFFSQVEDITQRRRSDFELLARARQQEAVARLGQVALRETDMRRLTNELVTTVAATLDVDVCKVRELSPGGDELTWVAGVGWDPEHAPPTRAPMTSMTHAEFTLASAQPVVVEDFSADERFSNSPVLSERGITSGLSVVIEGRDRPFGVLATYSTRPRKFSADDVNFVQAVANVLSTAVERQRSDAANRHAALHDSLTGLPNRALVQQRIGRALRRRLREGTTVAVLVLDLDRFKVINDSLGHARGDALLLSIAPRLLAAMGEHDTVGRLGGDEFVVICERVDGPDEAQSVAERLSLAINEPVWLESHEHVVSASIGIALTTGDDDTAESLLRDADAAMYRAKERGRGRHALFDEQLRAQVLGRLRVEEELRTALERGELRVHYQPVVDIGSGRPVSVEALVRWEHPERGLVPPGDFIPVAEETGLITELGLWVLEEGCRQMAVWQRRFDAPLHLCVNVSARQLDKPGFPAQVAEIARRSGMLPGTLGLEITESVLIEEAASPIAVLSMLREHDLRLILDDFGTGYSSLSYLKSFDLDALKVDRSFVRGLGSDPHDSTIVEAIIRMSQTLGLDVIAEGVETDEQLEQLRRLGCGEAQGFYFARPLPAEALTPFLAESLGAPSASSAVAQHGA